MPSINPHSDESEANTESEVRDDPGHGPVGLTMLAGAIATVIVVPVIWIIYLAMTVDIERSISMLIRDQTLVILRNTVVLIVAVTTLSVLIGVPLAVITTLTDLPFRRFWIGALALPLVIPSYTSAFAFISVWGPHGRLQSLLEPFGVESLPEIYGMWGTIFILALYNYPFVFITTVAGLRAIDGAYLEAARSLESSVRKAFLRVAIPLATPAIAAGALLAALETAGDFGVPAMLRYEVFTQQIYVEYQTLAMDYAAMLSLILVAITLIILALEWLVRRHRAVHGRSSGGSRTFRFTLGRWKWPALAACSIVLALAIVTPVSFLLWWLVTGPETYVGTWGFDSAYAFNSFYSSALAAIAAAALSLPIAYLSARHPSVLSGIVERSTYIGFAVPGVVIGLSLVFFGSRYTPSLYQTTPLLVFAYVVLYLPLAVGAARSAILYINPRFREAARSLGRSPLGAFREITLPLMAPGIAAGGALVFLHAMKELPATLLLRPIGFDTLATFIWTAERNAYFGYAAVPAIVLVLISGLSIVTVVSGDRVEYWRYLRRDWREILGMDDEDGTDENDGPPDGAIRDDATPNQRSSPGDTHDGDRPRKTGIDTDGGTHESDGPMLELDGLTKSFDGRPAVSELSLSVEDGEIVSLVGPSGCGKTTTLRLIAGLERPDAGVVRVAGETVADGKTFEPIEGRGVGVVFQDFALFPHKTVAENIAFGLGDRSTEEREEAVDELLETVGLEAYRESFPGELSGGQQQRVALARSLAPEPDILLLDEPLSDLDAGLRVRMRKAIRSIIDRVGVTAVWVTHDQEEALSVGDRTAVMSAGRIEQLDTPRRVFIEPASPAVAEFLGRASYLRGQVSCDVVRTPVGPIDRERVSLPEKADIVDILVRVDDIAVELADDDTADGRIVDRQFTGSTVFYRIELDDGTAVLCRHTHDEWFDVDTPVAIDIVAEHDLPAYRVEAD